MRVFSLSAGRRRTALGRIADGILESPDLASLTRLLTGDLPRALEAGAEREHPHGGAFV
jgi:hypothetical protein